ncbi:MAG TPA: RNA polymerase sigma factor [Ignavibacteriaceae bacterium]|nr:RNA polymerase sigma factor [Ignavibacteriaceae bacterium]
MTQQETELIISAQKGNITAFEQLIYNYDKKVLSLALKYVRNEEDARDIYQDVFIRVFKGLKNFQFKSEFSTWLYRIVTNVCLTHKTNIKKREFISIHPDEEQEENENMKQGFEIVDDKPAPDRITDSSEISEHINQALESLPARQKMIFILKHYEGYKLKEIAEILKCGEGTIKKYLFEAVRKMRTQLEDLYYA